MNPPTKKSDSSGNVHCPWTSNPFSFAFLCDKGYLCAAGLKASVLNIVTFEAPPGVNLESQSKSRTGTGQELDNKSLRPYAQTNQYCC